ncbi:MAG: cupin domain-containing protein, partial [Pseudomonadota bacterium]
AETMYVISGHGHAILGDQSIALAPGDTLFIPAHQLHGFEATEDMEMLYTFPTARFADVTYTYGEAA